ncbi:MAG TPA: metallophosphoesterase [Opitutaceae bacterium]|nr:metallophosphoesterase [Opitutaceae bacterium]
MPNPRGLISLVSGGFLAWAGVCRGTDAPAAGAEPPPIEEIAGRLPPDVGGAARKWLRGDPRELKALLAFSPGALEQEVMIALASEPDAADFVLGRMASETAETDRLILKVIVFDPFWVDQAGVLGGLRKLAESTADPDLMLDYLDAQRRVEARRLRRVLTARIAEARRAGDARSLEALAQADERWIMAERGASLPGFMRRPPAVFSVKPAGQSIRIVGMGDFGSGTQAQRDVAAAIVRMGRAGPFDFGITFGDNFYPSGMTGPDDTRWRDWWESLYGPLGIVFYPSLGNHDWYSDDGAAAEIIYRSPTWRFPAPYYSFTAGPVQFFVVDTTEISEAEVLWLDGAVAASGSRWKVVYGHHPIFAPERNAKSGMYMKYTQARLWPVIRGRVDAYLCGHQHAMAHMDPRDGVHFFMSGGGGAPLGKVAKQAPGAVFAESRFGFLTLEADASRMSIAIFDTDGNPFDSEAITK